ncbi:MAG: hypothetical protein KME32_30825 [Mojavia pulchra JT2-VF2]|jgi:hypothetical protein|uniref:PEP-CTERM sorting domain-containing protein n=1 Tax=Mojavia pulchra JT2-VF2 TaxID=287848 RepID=A0A951Q4Y4_9NOST|nr:hypothetical protein [Mojavia pulchra JT2-VF2]
MIRLISDRRILNLSLATCVTLGITACLPSKVMALITGFTDVYSTSNWTLTNSNADGTIDDSNATTVYLSGGNNGSGSNGTTDWTISIDSTRAGMLAFDWIYSTLDTEGDDTAGYLLNNIFYQLAASEGEASTSPVTVAVNSGDIFGFRVQTLQNNGGAGVFNVNNFQAQPVPYEFSPTLGLVMIFGLNGVYWQWRKLQSKSRVNEVLK